MNAPVATPIRLRASSMPLAFKCPASMRPELRVDETNEAASVGTAAHEALRPLAERGGLDYDAVRDVANRHGVDIDEVRMLCARAAKLWSTVRESFPGSITEADLTLELDGATLTGHVDLVSVSGDVARLGDWKTGRQDSDYEHQMRAYGALMLLTYPQLREVTVTILWVRDCEAENYTLTRADAVAWVARVEAEVVRWDGTYRPGGHCAHCPRSHECAAANARLRRDIAVIADKDLVSRVENELELMPAEQVVELVAKARMVEKLAGRVCEAVKAHVREHGDIVAPGVGRLTLETTDRRKADPLKAFPVLEAQGFGDAELAEVVTVSVSKAEKVVATKAGRGKGAAAVRALGAALAAAGAVTVEPTDKLVQKRV